MQTVSPQFQEYSEASVRPVRASVLFSFEKEYLPGVEFFTIGDSTIGGDDLIKGTGEVVQEWDKYVYTDYSDRLISLEWSRQEDALSSVSVAIADIVLDNHDNFFTPGSGSSIDGSVLPSRPVRIGAGFGSEDIPQMVGITEGMPIIDKDSGTVRFHCVDYLYSLLQRSMDTVPLVQNSTTDVILEEILTTFGLVSGQFQLDPGFNLVPYFYTNKGESFGDIAYPLLQAEMGRLFLSEEGVIIFQNRQNLPDAVSMSFDFSNIVDQKYIDGEGIINSVEVTSVPREVQDFQKLYELRASVLIPANDSIEIWADFTDPVTDVLEPIYDDGVTESYYATNVLEDGTGATNDAAISLDSVSLYSKSYLLEFSNSSSTPTYITNLVLGGTPVKEVASSLYVREEDADSIDKYEESSLPIDNRFIQDSSSAQSLALRILESSSELNDTQEIEVKGTPALQVRDAVTSMSQPYFVTKIENSINDNRFRQILTLNQRQVVDYFAIEISTIGGPDIIAP